MSNAATNAPKGGVLRLQPRGHEDDEGRKSDTDDANAERQGVDACRSRELARELLLADGE